MLKSQVMSFVRNVKNEKAKIILEKNVERLYEEKLNMFRKEKLFIIVFIGEIIKEYSDEDFTWESMTKNQNIDKIKFLENNYCLVKKFLSKGQINIWREDKREIGGIFYKEILCDIYSQIVKDGEISKFFQAKNKRLLGKYNKIFFNDYPVGVKLSYMIVCEYSKENKKIININCNTDNQLLKSIYKEFYDKYNTEGSNNIRLRTFFYYFSEILRKFKIKKYEEVNFEIIRNIYVEFMNIENIVKIRKIRDYSYEIFRFLIDKQKYERIDLNLEEAEKKALRTKVIGRILRENFKAVYYMPLENEPSSNKFCIIPNENLLKNSNKNNLAVLYCDIERVNSAFRLVVKEYIWNNDGNLRDKVGKLGVLYKFLEYITKDGNCDITLKKVYKYRQILECKTQNLNGLKSKLKVLRKFLKFYKEKYEFDDKVFDIFSLSSLEKPRGGEIITNNDLKLIYNEFLNLENKYENGKLYTIAFEICIYSNLRIGAILNLSRDCISKDGDRTYINYFPKTGGKEKIKVAINPKIEKLILKAIEITESLCIEQELSEYIFIEKYLRISGGVKRIAFSKYFKKIIQNLSGKLDKNNYTTQNIRDTYMNKVCDEARENNLSFSEIKAITNDSVKTIRKYYQQRNRVELMAENMFGIMINDVSCEGKILVNEEKNELKIIKDNLGKCAKNECVFDVAECLICKNFITFMNRKNVFIEKVKECDSIIQETNNKFVKEEKLYEKKLLTKYITEIIKLEQGEK